MIDTLIIISWISFVNPYSARRYLYVQQREFCDCSSPLLKDSTKCEHCGKDYLAPWDKVAAHLLLYYSIPILGLPLLHLTCIYWGINENLGKIVFYISLIFFIYIKLKYLRVSAEEKEQEDKLFNTRVQIYLSSLLRPSESTSPDKKVVSQGSTIEKNDVD
jgi:hypothetical protein